MLEIIFILVYLTHLVGLARSRGRSWTWALGGLALWLAADGVAWALFPHEPLIGSAFALCLALVGAGLYYRLVDDLDPVEAGVRFHGRGNNFPCPCCASLQTEDLAGHLECHACGSGFGRA